jgi:hypothetical protein
MHRISARLAACLVAAAAVGCGEAPAPRSGSVMRAASPAVAGHPGQNPGAPAAGPASAGAPSGCPGRSPAGPAVKTLTITLADNEQTYCLRVGQRLRVYLHGPGPGSWLRPLASSNALMPVPGAAPAPVKGATDADFAAVRPGPAVVTSIRPPCRIAIAPKGLLEPAFPLPKAYPIRFCAPGQRFRASIIVLR